MDLKETPSIDLLRELMRRHEEVSVPDVSHYNLFTSMSISNRYKENSAIGKSNPAIDRIWDYVGYPNYTDDVSWCAASLNCALKLSGYKMSDSVPVARSFANYGQKVEHNDLRVGDIVVLAKNDSDWQGHVGLLINASDDFRGTGKIDLLGGNQSNELNISTYRLGLDLTYRLLDVRRVTEAERVSLPDMTTIKKWELSI